MRKIFTLTVLIIVCLLFLLIDSIEHYIDSYQDYTKIEKQIVIEKKEIEKFKQIELKEYNNIGIPYSEFEAYHPIKKFDNITFLENQNKLTTLKSFDNKVYKEITTKITFTCQFMTFIDLLNYLKGQNLLYKIEHIEFKKNRNNQIEYKAEFSTIVYFEMVTK